MSPRYLLVAAAGDSVLSDLPGRLARRTGLGLAFANGRLAALVNRRCRCHSVGDRGCVLGTLFRRHGRAVPMTTIDESDTTAILDGRGDALLNSWWGGYVAAFSGRGAARVLRDPSAALPCYFAAGPDCVAFASDAELLVAGGFVPIDIDWAALGRGLFSAGVPAPSTALRGIRELLAGFAVDISGRLEPQQPFWSPWNHVEEQGGGRELAAERLERTVKHCVRAWAASEERLLVSVSGGLDSSIVAAALADAGARAVCLTMYTDDPGGDERRYARALCDRLGLPLVERAYRLEDIDIAEPLGRQLPRPKDRTQALAYERAHLDVAMEARATAFMTGNGGDSVFGYSQSATAIADRCLREGLGLAGLRTLRDVCRQTGCSPLEAAAAALRSARGPRAYTPRPEPRFLDPELLAGTAAAPLGHPWLDAPADALPGKAAHIASILRVQQCLHPGRSFHLPVLNPLMSQPVIEACLAVPSWEWRAGGRDRSLARRAFARDLPQSILDRRVKGGPDGFAARILDRFRPAIRERLLGGHLARERIVDRHALEKALTDERPTFGEERVRILELLAAEAWIDSWLARAASGDAGAVSSADGQERPDSRSRSQCSSSS